ncbi:MAG TPA: ATP-dependent zinc protease [Cyanothece sp. UBA12306]|nr:ATP-dependent zinc protease [Cyanothece sp. UBA12306]
MVNQKQQLLIIGWRERIALPELGIEEIKVKIDTGARSSALHALDIEMFTEAQKQMVRFKVHPYQRDTNQTIITQAELSEHRKVRSSTGHDQLRPVIKTMVQLGGQQWPIELTLTNRDVMGFRMLLGRQAIRGRFMVDSRKSFLASRRGKDPKKYKPKK